MADYNKQIAEWVDQGCRAKKKNYGTTAQQIAEASGIPPPALSRVRHGKRQLQQGEKERLELILGTPAPQLPESLRTPNRQAAEALQAIESSTKPTIAASLEMPTVNVIGLVNDEGLVRMLDPDVMESIKLPGYAAPTPNTVALKLTKGAIGPLFDKHFVLYENVETPPSARLLNRMCVVGLADGRIMLRRVARYDAGLYELDGTNPTIKTRIKWGAIVLYPPGIFEPE